MTISAITANPAGNSVLIEPGGYKVDFPWPVAQVILSHDVVIVRVEPSTGSIFNENVFGISSSGELLWQIKALKHVYEDSPYVYIKEIGLGVKLSNWDGDDVIIDPGSGAVLHIGYSK